MMSSILSKTLERTVSLLSGNASVQSECDVSLRDLQEGALCRDMDQGELYEKTEKAIAMLKRKSQDLHLSGTEKRDCQLMIAFLCSMNEDCSCFEPFVTQCIDDAKTTLEKSIAYMALVSLNQKSSSNAYLAVNTMLKDLSSRNDVTKGIAIIAACFLMDVDLIPVFLPSVEKVLKSDNPRLKYKALVLLHRMLVVAPEYLVSIWDKAVVALCDRNPYIMSASLPIISTLLKSSSPPKEMNVGKKIVFILKQVEQGCLPIHMMYGGISGPWIQIKLIGMIRNLPQDELSQCELSQLQTVFENIFARFQSPNRVQYAIIFECISTIISLHPRLEKLESIAFDAIESFLNSNKPNLFITGVELLKSAIVIRPGCTRDHAKSLVACLNGCDAVMVKPVLQLLDDFASAENVQSIVNAIMKNLVLSAENNKKDIVFAVLNIVEKFPMDGEWLMQNYNELLSSMKDEFDTSVIKRLLKCMQSAAMPSGDLESESLRLAKVLRQERSALHCCMALEIISFYNKRFSKQDCEKVLVAIKDICNNMQWSAKEYETILLVSWSTVLSLVTQHGLPISPKDFVKNAQNRYSVVHEQIYNEAIVLMENVQLATKTLPVQYADLFTSEIDPDLSFLNGFTEADGSESDADEECIGDAGSLTDGLQPTQGTKFKTEPYSRSRFEMRELPTSHATVVQKKNVFLSDPRKEVRKLTGAWNKNDYVVEKLSTLSKDDTSGEGNSP